MVLPRRVPPDQSVIDSDVTCNALSRSRFESSRVTRVKRVPIVKASTLLRLITAACMKRRRALA